MGASDPPTSTPASSDLEPRSLSLRIEPVIERAEELAQRVARELPTHPGLARAAWGVAEVAREAQHVSRRLQRFWGWHRLPALFLIVTLLMLASWVYFQFIHVSRLRIAVSRRDAVMMRGSISRRVSIRRIDTDGSTESLGLLLDDRVDLAFVQGGVTIPPELLREEIGSPETVLFYLRSGRNLDQMRQVLTSTAEQGSHTIAQDFVRIWGLEDQVSYVHQWADLTDNPQYQIPADIDAIFVVKDPLNANLTRVQTRIQSAGFVLTSPDIGGYSLRRPYLKETTLRRGYLDPKHHVPADPVDTYSVATYLVANPRLSPRHLAAADELVRNDLNRLDLRGYQPSLGAASEVLQGLESVLNIVIYAGLAFLALLGLDIYTYRGRFNELNSLISLISMHQSSKDIIGSSEVAHTVNYLSICSDLLGLISVIAGYYIQENSSLMYNSLVQVLHERTDGLKLNIQLKILHALIELPKDADADTARVDHAAPQISG